MSQTNLKEFETIKMESIFVFLDITKVVISVEKMPMSAELENCIT